MWLRKDRRGGAPGFYWEHDGDVLEVPDELGHQLLSIGHAGFSEAEPPAVEVDEVDDAAEIGEVEDRAENADEEEDAAAETPFQQRRPRGRPPKE